MIYVGRVGQRRVALENGRVNRWTNDDIFSIGLKRPTGEGRALSTG